MLVTIEFTHVKDRKLIAQEIVDFLEDLLTDYPSIEMELEISGPSGEVWVKGTAN